LQEEGKVFKVGRGRGTEYVPGDGAPATVAERKRYRTEGLEEDAVFDEMSLMLNLKSGLSSAAYETVNYAFCEMLNNAIEHSYSTSCDVECSLTPTLATFTVRDHGIGLFHSIREKYGLKDETEAMRELLKGKR